MISQFSETLVPRKLFVDAGWAFFPFIINEFKLPQTE